MNLSAMIFMISTSIVLYGGLAVCLGIAIRKRKNNKFQLLSPLLP
ncbi:MetS family NSS transporter small subunit, partial [bacterium]|nr:MetS family NSS transporter small subunit [bacterium]